MPLTANDLVYSQSTQRLYASVPSSQGSTGNSVAEIDPVAASITSQVFVGSEPAQLALADDNQTLYVGLSGAAANAELRGRDRRAATQPPTASAQVWRPPNA